ncbi:hypothetical protein FPQ18DRAFT_144602 [Pyronema domesticum]|nr:hypothetical protein FPQ18DRAFT_144602 [Pyronema domesticum]
MALWLFVLHASCDVCLLFFECMFLAFWLFVYWECMEEVVDLCFFLHFNTHSFDSWNIIHSFYIHKSTSRFSVINFKGFLRP